MIREELDKQELTYDFLKLNFVEDKLTPHLNLYPDCMLSTDKYYIGVQLFNTCDCRKQITVLNRENKMHVEFIDTNFGIDSFKRKFTVGDLRILLNLVGLSNLAEGLMNEEDIEND